jgi:hypothetical protein
VICFVCAREGATLWCGPIGSAHPACFRAWDIDQESREMTLAAAAPAFAPDILVGLVPLRAISSTPALVGERFGRLVVLREEVRLAGRARLRAWACRCDCGNETVIETYRLQRRGVSMCHTCSSRAAASRQGKRINGKTIAEWAQVTGLSLKGVWSRIQRGVPLEQVVSRRAA